MTLRDFIGPSLTVFGLLVAGLGSYFAQSTRISLLEQQQAGIIAAAAADEAELDSEIGVLRAQIDLMNIREREAHAQRTRIETRQDLVLQSVAKIEARLDQ